MEYIAVNNSSVYENTQSILVLKVDDTDELIDINNVEYIQNINAIDVSFNGTYGPLTEREAAEVNDMLQYWGSIHMFGTETLPNKTQLAKTTENNIKVIDVLNALNGKTGIDAEKEEQEFQDMASIIMGE